MAEPICFTAYTAKVVRFTKLNSLGRPVYGDCSTLVSKFVTITLTPEIDEGEEVSVKNSDGTSCLSVAPCPTLKYYTAEFEFCQVDPEVALFFNPKWRRVTDVLGTTMGWAEGAEFSCDAGFAAEIFLNAQTAQTVTEPGAEGLWFDITLPWMSNGAVSGDQEIGAENISFTFTANSRLGNGWGSGPYNVQRDANGKPVPLLVPMDPQEHAQKFLITIPPPEAKCGCQPLTRPDMTLTVSDDGTDPTGMTVELASVGVDAANVDWGDSSTEIVNSWPAKHIYAAAGTYPIKATDVSDSSRTASTNATVPFDRPALQAPANVKAASTAATNVALTWDAVTNATGYSVEYKKTADADFVAYSPAATTNSQTITGLTPATSYDFRVIATDGDDFQNSVPSNVLTASTTGARLDALANLTTGTTTASSVALTWDAVTNADTYTASYSSDSGTTWTDYATDFDTNAGTVDGLTASTEYQFRVVAKDSGGVHADSQPSSTVTATTAAP